jgi:ribonucleotide reductase class II
MTKRYTDPMTASHGDAFPSSAPSANPVFYRTYSRKGPQGWESWGDVVERNLSGLAKIGRLTDAEISLLRRMQLEQKALPSGRWLWAGGTGWITQPENFSGAYNCTSLNLVDWESLALMMDLAMMGCGTGAKIEPWHIKQLPKVLNRIEIDSVSPIGAVPASERIETTAIVDEDGKTTLRVGDSRRGWADAYLTILKLSSDSNWKSPIHLHVDLSHIRPPGEPLKGFGGVSNPVKLSEFWGRIAAILNHAQGRQLTSVECCLLIDEAAIVVVAGNIRRSAGMRQFHERDAEAATAKDNLWQQDADGGWRIDPERDALRMANHTRVFHRKPSLDEVVDSVRKQFSSGEGAIQYAPEAIARANADLLTERQLKQSFLAEYTSKSGGAVGGAIFLDELTNHTMLGDEVQHRISRYGLNPCGEIIGDTFHCNLSEVHLNQLRPYDAWGQEEAFRAAAISAASLLHHRFEVHRFRQSREWDPIIGISFTGLFDFFVEAFGVEWLRWFADGRPATEQGDAFRDAEGSYLLFWRDAVADAVRSYCERHGLRMPNRYTTVQPAGTKSLLTGASPGWHPPKAQRFIRRITFRKNDPVALACLDYGYTIVPSQSDKDENGRLLDDPFDPRCTEWLVEIPTEVPWANLPGADEVDLSQISALAQFDFYMQVQTHYTTHNTSATIEFREEEIEPLASAIHEAIQSDCGYISAALLARFDANEIFPRLPFEPIDHATYNRLHGAVLERRQSDDFGAALSRFDAGELTEAGPAGCDSDKCLLPLSKPE